MNESIDLLKSIHNDLTVLLVLVGAIFGLMLASGFRKRGK